MLSQWFSSPAQQHPSAHRRTWSMTTRYTICSEICSDSQAPILQNLIDQKLQTKDTPRSCNCRNVPLATAGHKRRVLTIQQDLQQQQLLGLSLKRRLHVRKQAKSRMASAYCIVFLWVIVCICWLLNDTSFLCTWKAKHLVFMTWKSHFWAANQAKPWLLQETLWCIGPTTRIYSNPDKQQGALVDIFRFHDGAKWSNEHLCCGDRKSSFQGYLMCVYICFSWFQQGKSTFLWNGGNVSFGRIASFLSCKFNLVLICRIATLQGGEEMVNLLLWWLGVRAKHVLKSKWIILCKRKAWNLTCLARHPNLSGFHGFSLFGHTPWGGQWEWKERYQTLLSKGSGCSGMAYPTKIGPAVGSTILPWML